jgi:hypothetical protein
MSTAGKAVLISGCQKRPVAFSDSLQNAVTFVLLCSTKVLASLASSLA